MTALWRLKMDKFIIKGGCTLNGEVTISGSKNAALPILIATMLSSDDSIIGNIPNLDDVQNLKQLLMDFGIKILHFDKKNYFSHIINKEFCYSEPSNEVVKKFRASILMLGPLLAKIGKAKISLPGGCAIGKRPVNMHLDGLSMMGANMIIENDQIKAHVPNGRLSGARIKFRFPSVGATENIMMAACLADGTTILENAAQEPEIIELAQALNSMGSIIIGAGTRTIQIIGQKSLKGMRHIISPDRIEIGTFIAMATITGGNIFIKNVCLKTLQSIVINFQKIGCNFHVDQNGVRVNASKRIQNINIKTAPYPGFPTDMQAQIMSCLCVANGISYIQENVWENRFMHTLELTKMGADISTHGNLAIIKGKNKLTGSKVKASDLRASAGLIIAALSAEGTSEILHIHHLDRGYVTLENKLVQLGVDILRVNDSNIL